MRVWGLEAASASPVPAEILVNDADGDRRPLLEHNLRPVAAATCSSVSAERLLCEAQLEGRRFDLIDLDAFGHPGALIQPALQAPNPSQRSAGTPTTSRLAASGLRPPGPLVIVGLRPPDIQIFYERLSGFTHATDTFLRESCMG